MGLAIQLVSTMGTKKSPFSKVPEDVADEKAKPLSHTLTPWVIWFSGFIFPKDGDKGAPLGEGSANLRAASLPSLRLDFSRWVTASQPGQQKAWQVEDGVDVTML